MTARTPVSDTWTALQLARDAWDSGRLSESYRLMPEPDFEYVERTRRARVFKRSVRSLIARELMRSAIVDIDSARWDSGRVTFGNVDSGSRPEVMWMNPDNYRRLSEFRRVTRTTAADRERGRITLGSGLADEWPDLTKYFERWARARISYPPSTAVVDV